MLHLEDKVACGDRGNEAPLTQRANLPELLNIPGVNRTVHEELRGGTTEPCRSMTRRLGASLRAPSDPRIPIFYTFALLITGGRVRILSVSQINVIDFFCQSGYLQPAYHSSQ